MSESMDTADHRRALEKVMAGRRVFAMLPSHTEARADYLVGLLKTAKARWGWQIDMLCQPADRAAFRELAGPGGSLFTPPQLLEPAAWEADPERVAAVDRRLGEAEIVTRVALGQIVLASQGSIGQAFMTSACRLNPTPLSQRVLRDNTEPFRIARRLFQSADEMIEASAPDLLLAYEWEKPWRSTIWMAATYRGIPCIAIRRSKLNPDHYFWTTDRVLFNVAARERAIAKRKSGAPVSDVAKERIRDFRQQPTTIKYVDEKWRQVSKKSWLKWHVKWGRAVAAHLLAILTFRGAEQPKSFFARLVRYNHRAILAKRHPRFLHSFDDAALAAMAYIYFPMHKENDLPLIFQAPRWHDQRNTVQSLAAALPSGYRLLVREHRLNIGDRPTRYYRELSQLPNVVLIDAFESQFKYVRNADLVVTENGSSGWEGLLLGRRVLTLSRTYYDGAGLARKVDDPDQVGATVLEALAAPAVLDQPEHDRGLGAMIDAERETTFPMDGSGMQDVLDRLADAVGAALPQHRPVAAAEAGEPREGAKRVASPMSRQD
jgi:hypothetical protein